MSYKRRDMFPYLLALALTSTIAKAQPVFVTHRSLEARIAQAESVFRGTISHLSRTGVVPSGGKETPDGIARYTITVSIAEVLKGPQRKTIELVRETFADDQRFDQWFGHRTSFLWFMGPSEMTWEERTSGKPRANAWTNIRLGQPVLDERGRAEHERPVFAMDFTCLEDSKEILSRARKIAKRHIDTLRVHTFALGKNGPWSSLDVPVVPSLERIAKRLIKSPGEFLSAKSKQTDSERQISEVWRERLLQAASVEERRKIEDGRARVLRLELGALRVEGIRALQYFKSMENISLLKSLLKDEAWRMEGRGDDAREPQRVYYIREAAYEALREWGVEVSKPWFEGTF